MINSYTCVFVRDMFVQDYHLRYSFMNAAVLYETSILPNFVILARVSFFYLNLKYKKIF